MAEVIQTRRASPAAPAPRGPVESIFYSVLTFALWLIVGLFGNILVEWLCMGLIWPEQGPRHSQQQLEAEIRYLRDDLKGSVFTQNPSRLAVTVATEIHQVVFEDTGLVKAVSAIQQVSAKRSPKNTKDNNPYQALLRQFGEGARNYMLAGMLATQVYALRLTVLFLSIPVFVLAGLVGAVDGIVQRDVNRWRGGRELGQRYHLAKSMVAPGLTLPWFVYLAWPSTVHPYLIILPFALFVGIVVAVTTATFKKYF